MSFIITVHTSEGIIMASDSRTTISITTPYTDGKRDIIFGTQMTDTTYKTFLCNSKIGISTCGAASINNIPIAGFIEKFIAEKATDEDITVEAVAKDLNDYFSLLSPGAQIHFLISGYGTDSLSPIIYQIKLENEKLGKESIIKIDTSSPGAVWDGEITTLSKLIMPIGIKQDNGTYIDMSNNGINWNFFTLQDAINFANYAVDVTIKTMAFENCAKTVGGPIDILAIKPDKAFWVAHKELHA